MPHAETSTSLDSMVSEDYFIPAGDSPDYYRLKKAVSSNRSFEFAY
jgi:hypothetical protein